MIERTQKKLREALYFLSHLERELTSGGANPNEAVEFYLSAFLSAARSVTFVLESEEPITYPEWSPRWLAALTETERQLLAKFTTARNRALKRETPTVSEDRLANASRSLPPALQFFFEETTDDGPSTGPNRALKGRLTPEHAEEEVLPTCRQYADLLSRLVAAFLAAHK